jgi:PHP family Zn ribbon phosphoesterase
MARKNKPKRKRRKTGPRKRTSTVVCRDCHYKFEITPSEYYSAFAARCRKCGGQVDKAATVRRLTRKPLPTPTPPPARVKEGTN